MSFSHLPFFHVKSQRPSFFILASGSPRRRELLALLELPFQVEKAAVAEAVKDDETPAETATRLAQTKARAVADHNPRALVLGCDTIVAFEGEPLGKPAGPAEARTMLTRLRNRSHAVYTGLALAGEGREAARTVETMVHMRGYTDAEVEAYVASGDPLDKAGAYAIQNAAFSPVARWKGCYANVMGLPLCHVLKMLQEWQISPSGDLPAACQAHTQQTCTVFPSILNTS